MADSDKDILITPNTGVATTHPKMTFTGKDNSPVDLKILDDNTLSFEGTQGQVFSISPILNSGDIFSVNDISGIQSMAINADGTISMNAQTKSVTITNSASNVSNLILENTNADEVDGPILEFYRNTVSPADGGDAGTLLFTGQDDGGNKQEYGRITMEFDDVSNSGEEGELIFRLTESGSAEQEYMRLRGSSRQIEFNTGQDDIDLVWNSDSENDIFYCNAGTSRVGIGTNAPAAKLHVDTQSTIAPSLTFGAVAGQILQNENSEFAFGLDNDSPYSLWIQGRNSGNAARDISLQPLGGKIGIGTEAPSALLHIEDDATSLVTGLLVTNTGSAGNSGTLAGIEIKNGAGTDSSTHIEQDAFGRTLMYTGQAEKNLFLTGAADGKVGIGTNSPASKLHVIGGANDEVVALFTTAGGTSSSVEGIAHIGLSHFSSDTAPSVSISAEEIDDGDHRADFRINTRESASSNATPTEKLRVTSAGHVLIGTTSYSGTSSHAGLEVSHATQANLRVTDSSASASSDFAQSENDLYIVNRKSGGNIRMRVGGSTETILMDSDGDIKFANGATSSWATWNSVVFYRHSYDTTNQSGLYVSNDSATGIQKNQMIPFTAKIRAVAFHFNGANVDYSSTSNNSWNIFRAGQTSDSFATVTFNNGQGTRLQSGGSDTNQMYYVVTGLNISVAAGDTVHIRRETGTTNVGNVRVEIFYSHV